MATKKQKMNEYPKRLIEVDLPIARISAHSRREKSIRHGHISTLHIWWARRPLAACRAVICASLWPDPADEFCPPAFREVAVEQIKQFANRVFPKKITAEGKLLSSEKHLSVESRGRWEAIAAETLTLDANEPADMPMLRMCLLDFIADFANWDNSTVPAYLETSRALTQAAHEALGGAPGTRPLVVDPFAGGGSIPLEALRVGADAFASDLNPVAVLLNKVVLEYIPKYGQRLADEVRKWGQWVKEQAEQELAEFYPKDPDGATPIAYLWARTIKCEGPGCGMTIPLAGSFWICRKREPRFAIAMEIGEEVSFSLLKDPKQGDVPDGLTSRNKATCPRCGYTNPTDRVKAQLKSKQGGSDDAQFVGIVTTDKHGKGKQYRAPKPYDEQVANSAADKIVELEKTMSNGFSAIPDEQCPPIGALGFRFQAYGIEKWMQLYTPRQLASLTTFANIVSRITDSQHSQDDEILRVVQTLLALAVGRMNDRCCSLCRWEPDYLKIQAANGAENKMPMRLDFVESNPFGGKSGDWLANIEWISKVVEHVASLDVPGDGNIARSAA